MNNNLQWFVVRRFLLLSLLLSTFAVGGLAQGYGVGDRVIFDYHQTPTEGEIIGRSGDQYLIRSKGEFGDNEACYPSSKILRKAGQPANNPDQPANAPDQANNPPQAGGLGAGQKVLVNYHGEWIEGELIREEGGQLFVKYQTPYGPGEAYYPPDKVKPWAPGAVANDPVAPRPDRQPNNPDPANPRNPGGDMPAVNPGGGGGLMSEQELKSYLDANLGGNPWGPNRNQVLDALRAQIMTRGVNWHYGADSPLYQETIRKFGLLSDITRPLDDNFGPNPSLNALFGAWKTEVNGPTTYSVNGAAVYRHNPIHATTGSLTIDPGGSYSWITTNGQVVKGTWRPATTPEMQYTGGEGLVLTSGRGGWDWIVTKFRDPTPANMSPNWINIFELTTRQERQFGNR